MNIYWKNPVSADFGTASDWSTGTVPSVLDIAKMTVAGTYTITDTNLVGTIVLGITTGSNTTLSLSSSPLFFEALEGTATGANRGVISVGNSADLVLGGVVNNIGSIDLNAAGFTTELDFLQGVTLKGGGKISTTNNQSNFITAKANSPI